VKSRLYLETTIPSYLTSRPSRDLIIAGHQQVTREWWEKRRDKFQLYLSQLVIDEVSAGDPAAARERLKTLRDFPLLDITPEVTELASGILATGKVPRKAAADAAHIAIAAVHGIDFLMTWNCVHIANATNARALALICRKFRYDCPVICTPEELMGE
jgi:predicted nucleic acid-binding protein